MKRFYFLSLLLFVFHCQLTAQNQPNIVLIFADDLGYNDLSSYGAPLIQTPELDDMANNGIRLNDFYVPHSTCTPSRVALMTGRYAARTNLTTVIFPGANGLDADEVTMAEVLKNVGYSTACIGKWHLGDNSDDLPRTQGFDYYYGIPYSNDMNPTILMENETTIENPVDQTTLTQRYTTEALDYIQTSHDNSEPFFLYLPHTFPHIPLFASPDFLGESAGGLYGDVVEEMDWSVGQIRQKLQDLGIADNTIVIFTSDNGPWLSKGDQAGDASPLRGGKFDAFEGGVRVPFIAEWPGQIPAGTVSDEPMITVDLFPTLLNLAGADNFIPSDRTIDGRDAFSVLQNTAPRDWDQLYIYRRNNPGIRALRCGKWKAHFNNELTQVNQLYDLENDISESNNVVNSFPEISADMLAKVQAFDRQENDVALYGVYPLSYYGQQGGGADLSVLEAGNNFLIDDLSATIQTVPQTYQGGVLVQYGSVDQVFSGPDFITLSSVADGQLLVAYDAQATTVPSWLSSWTPTGENLAINFGGQSHTMNIFTKALSAGDLIELGGNQEGGADGAVPYIAAMMVPPTGDAPGVQSPFNGQAFAVPGVIQAEEYDLGGPGVAYQDSDATNNGGQFRPDEEVDINTTSDVDGAFHVGWTEPGEWMEYTVEVANAGNYDIFLRVAVPENGKKCHVAFNGQNLTGSIDLPITGSYQDWQTVVAKNIPLGPGTQVMRFVSETGTFNLNYIEIQPATLDPGEILYRINSGAVTLAATDGSGIDWATDTEGSPTTFVNATASGNRTNSFDDPITRSFFLPNYVPTGLFPSERFSSPSISPTVPLEFDFPVAATGYYSVNLFFAEVFRNDNDRVFDISIEGELKEDDFIIHQEVGGDVAMVKSYAVEVTDGNIDIDLLPQNLLPKINAVEIIYIGQADEGTTDLTLDFTLEDKTDIDAPYLIQLFGSENMDVPLYIFTPEVAGESNIVLNDLVPGTYQLVLQTPGYEAGESEITLAADSDNLGLGELPLEGGSSGPEILYRINVGAGELPAADVPNMNWSTDTEANPSPYVNAAETKNNTSSTGNAITLDPSVPGYVPVSLFQTDRFSSNPGDPVIVPMEWDFPVQESGTYQINLLFAEIFRNDNQRRFDIVIEGTTVLPDYSVHEDVGHDVGVLKTFTAEVTDGNIDIDLVSTGLLPKVNGIEIIQLPEQEPETADLSITLNLQGRSTIDDTYSVALFETSDLSTPAYEFNPTVSGGTTIDLEGLLPGEYTIKVKADHFLQKTVTVTLAAGANSSDIGVLLNGDVDNDNEVGMLDFAILAGSYELDPSDGNFDARADLNTDGLVNILDFALLAVNYEVSGDQ